MEPVDKKMAALISGIEADVRAEEEKLVQEAQRRAEEKTKYAQKQAESLLAEARESAAAEAATIDRQAVSAVDREISRRSLRLRDTMMHRIMDRAAKRIEAMLDDPAYRDVLVNWIAEAAVGLSTDTALINASARERAMIDKALLAEARKRAAAHMGESVTLKLADAEPLEAQGVVLTTEDGRMAFNNQVRTRMSRKGRQIQKLIYDAVFADSQEE